MARIKQHFSMVRGLTLINITYSRAELHAAPSAVRKLPVGSDMSEAGEAFHRRD